MLVWLSVWIEVQIVCIWSSWCHCHPKTPSSLTFFKSRPVLPFWYQLTEVVLEKGQLNGCSSSSNSSSKPVVICVCSNRCSILFFSVLDPRVGHSTDVLSPFIPVLCHSDWRCSSSYHGACMCTARSLCRPVQQDQCRVNIIALLTRRLSVTVLHHPTTLTTLLQPPVQDSTVHNHVHVYMYVDIYVYVYVAI